ncbi:MAG: hypothetical protein ACRDRK_11935 [Pseudonocardia sp.]
MGVLQLVTALLMFVGCMTHPDPDRPTGRRGGALMAARAEKPLIDRLRGGLPGP